MSIIRTIFVRNLAQHLEHLDPLQRETVLQAAIDVEDESDRSTLLGELGSRAACLSTEQRTTLLDDVDAFQDDENKAWVLQMLGGAWPDLSGPERQRVLDMVLGPQAEAHAGPSGLAEPGRGKALSGLCLAMPDLDPELRRTVFDATLELTEEPERFDATLELTEDSERFDALCALAARVAHLDDDQRDRLVAVAVGGEDEESRARLLAALGRHMVHLRPDQRTALVNAAIALGRDGRAVALHGLGCGAAALSSAQPLIDAVNNLDAEAHRAFALAGLALGVTAGSETTDFVIGALDHLQDPASKALVIAALGRRAAVLERCATKQGRGTLCRLRGSEPEAQGVGHGAERAGDRCGRAEHAAARRSYRHSGTHP